MTDNTKVALMTGALVVIGFAFCVSVVYVALYLAIVSTMERGW